MARILHKLPVPQEDAVTFVREEMVRVRAFEAVAWVSLAPGNVYDPARLPRFPVLLDTGHTHNFSIQQRHLERWAGLRTEHLSLGRGEVRHQGRRLVLRAAALWIHPNERGSWERVAGRPPYRLDFVEGILVYPPGADFPRLPLLGLRAILTNKLRLTVDGDRGLVSLRSGPWWWPFA
jgi:hypothetical protein